MICSKNQEADVEGEILTGGAGGFGGAVVGEETGAVKIWMIQHNSKESLSQFGLFESWSQNSTFLFLMYHFTFYSFVILIEISFNQGLYTT